MDTADINDLRAEIDRLARELDQASSEKIQSAKYGLGLLEEKCMLQQKCEELETLYENAKHDLEITQEVGGLFYFYLFYRFNSTVYSYYIEWYRCVQFNLWFSTSNEKNVEQKLKSKIDDEEKRISE